ncbi:MAG TPA: glycine cleavage system protein GcvH [Oceanithermus profundus]|uniref:Glycine cleavage system H protein n=1 Tax=Oceanithermus profundus TaxID=187137 RepID=A0A7C4Z5T5_9DEIN|nr:glycine cleavage system protein GcvH [Oceanithermus profundus]
MNVPADRKYTRSHEWAKQEDGRVVVGISDFAQESLGDVVFVETPEVGREVQAGEAVAVVESVKTASDIYAPVSGKVVEVNEALADEPELVNGDPYGAGWIFKLEPSDPAEMGALLGPDDYTKVIEEES